jgi:hypothetical protein
MNVMTESGESVGKIDKVTINEDGTVASYHSSTGFFGSKHDIEASEVKSGSKDMLIIADDAREGAVKTVTGVTSEPRPRLDEAENGVTDNAREAEKPGGVTGVTSEPRPRLDEAENDVSDPREGAVKNVTA